MISNQSATVDRNMVELIKATELVTPVVISYMQISGVLSNGEVDMIKSEVTSPGKLNLLFGILKTKDTGWTYLMSYLRDNGQSQFANKLENEAAGEIYESGPFRGPKRSALEEFSFRLAQYYQRYYANVPTMGQSDKHVKEVWVPLTIDRRKEDFLAADLIDHFELLNTLTSSDGADVALIKGDPGMGKTTLAKKIAYDWAVTYGNSDSQQFSLVLAVPLRSAGKSDRLDQLAIDYFLSVLGFADGIDKIKLIKEINQLKFKLLVIHDGLDEFANYTESPFKDLFAAPFQHSFVYSTLSTQMIDFKLIITSRPYACKRIQMSFPLLNYVILPLDECHMVQFVQVYCRTSQGVAKVTKYLRRNAKWVIQVPLILTFICYLADSVQEIPTNMTSLYDSFIRQMISRENRQEKLAESVNIQSWKDTNVVKTTSELAYRGIIDVGYDQFEFSRSDLDKCHVTNDSFICGFLLHKFNFAQESLKAEFPHLYIQEFFVAIHCFHLMLDDNKDVLSQVHRIIINGDNLVGRFFLGICSKERRFGLIRECLIPSLFPPPYGYLKPAVVINAFGAALADCSPEHNCAIGQMLFDSAAYLNDYTSYESFIRVAFLGPELSDEFKKGLHLGVLFQDDKGLTTEWFLADNRISARLVFVRHRLQELLEEKFDQIDALVLEYNRTYSSPSLYSVNLSCAQRKSDSQTIIEGLVHQIQLLPNVITLVITRDFATTTPDDPVTTTTVLVRYGRAVGLKLTTFQFNFDTNIDKAIILGIVAREKLANLTVYGTIQCRNNARFTFRKLEVTVNEDMSQETLIFSLIVLSLLR